MTWKGNSTPFLAENRGSRLGGANSPSHHFTLDCKLPQPKDLHNPQKVFLRLPQHTPSATV